jgi:hypothetical protein
MALIVLPACGAQQQKSSTPTSPRASQGPATARDVRYQLLYWAGTIDPVTFATDNWDTKDATFSDMDLLKVGLSTTKPGDVLAPEVYVEVLETGDLCHRYTQNPNPSDHDADADAACRMLQRGHFWAVNLQTHAAIFPAPRGSARERGALRQNLAAVRP